jgi:hypothetical protein
MGIMADLLHGVFDRHPNQLMIRLARAAFCGGKLDFEKSAERIGWHAIIDPELTGAAQLTDWPNRQASFFVKFAHDGFRIALARLNAAAWQIIVEILGVTDFDKGNLLVSAGAKAVNAGPLFIGFAVFGAPELHRKMRHKGLIS